MKTIQNENVIFFDVDDTLVLWESRSVGSADWAREARVNVVDPYDNKTVYLTKHQPHIKLLMNHKARGSTVVVWSQGGYAWAEAVVKALGLEEYVDLIMSKPRTYVDDLPVSDWLKDRVYISRDSSWGSSQK
jgi:phosphoserine phosphatase